MADTLRLVVPADLAGSRLDRALAILLGISRSEARALVDRGVTLDGAPARPRSTVTAGSILETGVPDHHSVLAPEPVPFSVVLEASTYLVVDKPPGLVVHPGSGNRTGTLAAGLLHRYPDLEGVGAPGRWGLVHRLDRDTSGVLIVARTEHAYEVLSAELSSRNIKRIYTALVAGAMSIPTGTIDAPIGRDPRRPTRRAVVSSGKPALTHYVVKRSYPGHDVALLEVRLDTGRTHQIRVHLAAIDHPVIGDHTYGSKQLAVRSPRTFLHASRIEFTDPETGSPVAASAPLPADLVAVLAGLGEGASA